MEAAYLNNLNLLINEIMTIFQAAIGIPLNLLSIFIFSRLMKNKTNIGFLGIIQCITDLLILSAFSVLFRSFPYIIPIMMINYTNTSCKILTFLRRFMLHISSWMRVLITFDRFIFILFGYRNRFPLMKSKRFLAILISIVFLILAIVDIPNFFFNLNAMNQCSADSSIIVASDLIWIFLRTYLPFALMLGINIYLIVCIKTKRAIVFTNNDSQSRREYQFTIAVIVFNVSFFVYNSPLSVYYIVYDVVLYSGAFADPLINAKYTLVYMIAGGFAILDQSLSFFMHFAFNKLFRQEILYLIKSRSIRPGNSSNIQS